jgi:hypothetical protein
MMIIKYDVKMSFLPKRGLIGGFLAAKIGFSRGNAVLGRWAIQWSDGRNIARERSSKAGHVTASAHEND